MYGRLLWEGEATPLLGLYDIHVGEAEERSTKCLWSSMKGPLMPVSEKNTQPPNFSSSLKVIWKMVCTIQPGVVVVVWSVLREESFNP